MQDRMEESRIRQLKKLAEDRAEISEEHAKERAEADAKAHLEEIVSRARERAAQERARIEARERELESYREVIQRQEREFESYRARLKEEQLLREKELQEELEAREKLFAERERKLIERQREFENHLMGRQAETEALREHLQSEIANREARLQQAFIELQQEKERYNEESRKKIETTSKDYVVDALETLDRKERQFHRISKLWSGIGAGALAVGIGFFGFVSLSSAITLPTQVTWEFITFTMFKGLVAVALLAGLSKYSFLFSSSYMKEALKNADRRHAINFGKFYLESYGAAADWSQVKDAFKHWNITGSNAFTNQEETPPDAASLDKAVSLIENASKAIFKAKSGGEDKK